MVYVRYIGKKDKQVDVLYDSGTAWNGSGDIQRVSEDLATKLLGHKGVYEHATEEEMNATHDGPKADSELSFTDAVRLVVALVKEIDPNSASDEELALVNKAADVFIAFRGISDDNPIIPDSETNESDLDKSNAPTDPAIRQQQIVDAINTLNTDDESLWGKTTGKPRVRAIELILGFDIKASERDAACVAIDVEDGG